MRLSDVAGERPHLVVLADLSVLKHPAPAPPQAGARAAEPSGSGPVSPDLARRIACDGSVTRILTTSTPEDTGPPGAGPPTGGRPDTPQLDPAAVRALLPPRSAGP